MIAKHPPWRLIPEPKVEVAEFATTRFAMVVVPRAAPVVDAEMKPPVRVRPFDEERPAADTPPAKVEVPVPITAKFVVVADEVVALRAVKFWSVVDERAVSEPGKT